MKYFILFQSFALKKRVAFQNIYVYQVGYQWINIKAVL